MRRIVVIAGLIALALLGWSVRSEAAVPPECSLSAGVNFQPNEGPSDETLYLPSVGTLRAVMIFVDFPDAPQSETTRSLYDLLVPYARRWYREVSYGELALKVTRTRQWYRMPRSSAEYGFADGTTFEEHRAYIADAIAVSDLDVDYARYDLVYIVSSQGAAIPLSPTFIAPPGTGAAVDGTEVRHAVTFGEDIRFSRPNYGSHILIHETGHLLGLPDLYEYGTADPFDFLRFVGGWDVMSWVAPGAHFLLWHKLKLGWVEDDQVTCISSGQITETITPLEVVKGFKGIVVRTGPSSAYVVEVRQLIGQDRRLCDRGVLIYTVDAATPNGSGPVIVQPAQTGTDPTQLGKCGPLYDAPFDLGPAEVLAFSDPSVGLTVEVLSRARNSYLVRVTKAALFTPDLFTYDIGAGVPQEEIEVIQAGFAIGRAFLDSDLGGDMSDAARSQITVKIVATGLGNEDLGGGGACCTAMAVAPTGDSIIRPFFDVAHPNWNPPLDSRPLQFWSLTADHHRTVTHEYVHGWQHDLGCISIFNQPLGIWLNEGIAEYVAYEAMIRRGAMRRGDVLDHVLFSALVTGQLYRPLVEFGGTTADIWPGHVGYVAVNLLVQAAPTRLLALRAVCLEVAAGASVADAFHAAFGGTLENFYAAFETLRQQYLVRCPSVATWSPDCVTGLTNQREGGMDPG